MPAAVPDPALRAGGYCCALDRLGSADSGVDHRDARVPPLLCVCLGTPGPAHSPFLYDPGSGAGHSSTEVPAETPEFVKRG